MAHRRVVEQVSDPLDVEALLAGTTPGPWRWGGSLRDIRLEAAVSMRPCVMAFRRKGMQGAEPVFWDRSESLGPGGSWGSFCTATDRAVREASYRDDIKAIDTPDARLIAAAPTLAAEVVALREALEAIAVKRGEDDYDDDPAQDWRMLALKMERIARKALGLTDE